MIRNGWFCALMLVVVIASGSCSDLTYDTVEENAEAQALGIALGRGETVTRWVEQAMQTVRERNIGTPNAGRLYAMVSGAMYDAVNGIDRARHIGREHAIVAPTGAPLLGRRDAAAAAAAHAVLVALVPAQAPALDSALAGDLAHFGTGPGVAAGVAWGTAVGDAVVAARAADGTQTPENVPAGTAPGQHRAVFDATFRDMTPFAIASQAPFASPPPPALDSAAYAVAYNDVKTLGVHDCDALRNEISNFWLAEAGTPRETGTWLQATIAIARDRRTEPFISPTARLFALVAMAIADAVSVSWETKATYFTWRPMFAIREGDTDSNPATDPDPAWTPRVGTPGASPEYSSGLSTFSGAASAIIEGFYCRERVRFCFATDLASNGPRCFASPLKGAEEAGRSRIYQGIHFQFSNEDGHRVGRLVGAEIASTRLQRVGPLDWVPDCGY